MWWRTSLRALRGDIGSIPGSGYIDPQGIDPGGLDTDMRPLYTVRPNGGRSGTSGPIRASVPCRRKSLRGAVNKIPRVDEG
jgi:hypothetical protein